MTMYTTININVSLFNNLSNLILPVLKSEVLHLTGQNQHKTIQNIFKTISLYAGKEKQTYSYNQNFTF